MSDIRYKSYTKNNEILKYNFISALITLVGLIFRFFPHNGRGAFPRYPPAICISDKKNKPQMVNHRLKGLGF